MEAKAFKRRDTVARKFREAVGDKAVNPYGYHPVNDEDIQAMTDKARKAVAEFNQATAALPAAQAALDEAKGTVLGAQSAARQADRTATAARAATEVAEAGYRQAEERVELGRKEISAFVNAAYRGDTVALLNSIMESDSPSDLVNRIGYLDHVASVRSRALAELTVARAEAKRRNDAAAAERVTAERAAASVRAIIGQRAAASAAVEAERGAVLAQYNQLKAESARLAAELRAAANSGGGGTRAVPSGGSGGYLRMPVSGRKSSNYGMRFDPYYKVSQLHAGTDFAAAGGSPIVAAADGRVVRTGWAGGYGNYTCILHGNYQRRGMSTCYGHQSAILVSVGQHVGRGQVIGRVGSTGASTGNHLHFEVRLDGSPVDPLPWLPSCLC